MRPNKHAIIETDDFDFPGKFSTEQIDMVLRIESRDIDGKRLFENDLDLEIYKSGDELNLTIGWSINSLRPILWQGQHSVWMDGNTGRKINPPNDGDCLETFARRIRALIENL